MQHLHITNDICEDEDNCCFICKESDGEILSCGCGCKGENNMCHIECLAEFARVKQNTIQEDLGKAYIICQTCNFQFTGPVYEKILQFRKKHVLSGINFKSKRQRCIHECEILDHEAKCCSLNNKNEEGIQYAYKSYKLARKIFGNYHHNTVLYFDTYALLHTNQENCNYEMIVSKYNNIINNLDDSILNKQTWYNTIGLLYLMNNAYEKAEKIFKTILEQYRNIDTIRVSHKNLVKCELISALILQNKKDKKEEALKLLDEIWKPLTATFPRSHEQIYILEKNLKKFKIFPDERYCSVSVH